MAKTKKPAPKPSTMPMKPKPSMMPMKKGGKC